MIMALISPYTNQPFSFSFQTSISICWNNKRCCHFLLYKQLLTFPVIF
jgi:hypothetical protein